MRKRGLRRIEEEERLRELLQGGASEQLLTAVSRLDEGAVVRVPKSLLASLSDTMTPQGVLAVVPQSHNPARPFPFCLHDQTFVIVHPDEEDPIHHPPDIPGQ